MTDPATGYREAGYRAAGLWTAATLAELVPAAAARHPDRELFRFADRRVSYREFEAWTRAVAADLVARGVHRGERVLVQLPNRLEALAVQVAAFRVGAVDVLVDGERDGWTAVPEASAHRTPELPEPPPADEPVLLLYTSGTTSAPKGALLSSRAVYAHLANFRDALGAGEHTVPLAATPLSHLSGFVAAVVFPAYLGGRSVVMPAWRPDEAVELIDRERVNLMMGATVFIADLVERYERGAGATHRLDTYAAAGAALAPEVVDRAAAVGVDVVRAYGMTETAGVCAIASAGEPLERRRTWDGRLLPGMEIQAVDDDGRPVPPGTLGHLRIRGPQLLTGYTDAARTAGQLDAEGWFHPGDLGRVDDHGWVQVAGRTKDIVNRGGEKFSTLDIEQAIAAHPGVRAVAVTAVPDDRLGEGVGAWIVAGDPAPRPEGLLAHLETVGLARQKFPVRWHLVAQLPVTASGKIQKHRLADLEDLATWTTRPEGSRA